MFFIFIIILALLSLIAAVIIPRTVKGSYETHNLGILKGAMVALALFFGVVAVFQLITVVPAGHVGIVDTFGHVATDVKFPGLNFVNPFARVRKLSVQTQELKEVMEVPSKEGLNITIEISALFHLDPEKAVALYKTVGVDYVNTILIPNFRSVVRGVTAGYDAKALYTSERETLANLMLKELKAVVAPRGVIIEANPLRRITLPPQLAGSIESKLQADQDSQRMQFVLTKEAQEAERKRIEAKGIQDFQNIVTQGITEPLLRWKGIEATELLAKSSNTKVIVIGSGKDGLPLIMDTK